MKILAIIGIKMSTFVVLIFAMYSISASNAEAQFRDDALPKPMASGKAAISDDEFFRSAPMPQVDKIPGLEGEPKVILPSHKSPFLAGMLSIVLPGLGEYYVGDQIWRGIIFTVVDAGLWYERYHYIARGNDSTAAFQAFSDANWSPQIYSDSLNSLLLLAQRPDSDLIKNSNDFSQINKAENLLNKLGFLNFTHQLAAKGSQDYYEIISKYIQFRLGWKDFIASGPEYSPDYERAAYMRASLNYQFQIADYFLYGLFLDRILSAIDAALLAKDHNSPVHLEGGMQKRQFPDGTYGFVPTAHLQYTF